MKTVLKELHYFVKLKVELELLKQVPTGKFDFDVTSFRPGCWSITSNHKRERVLEALKRLVIENGKFKFL